MVTNAVNKFTKQRGKPFKPGASGNPRGRPRGSRNKRTRAMIEAAQAGGQLPLDYMLAVMRDPRASPTRRDEMAKAAAPYLHSRLLPSLPPDPEHQPSQLPPVQLVVNFVDGDPPPQTR
jgi:hypothetical protein